MEDPPGEGAGRESKMILAMLLATIVVVTLTMLTLSFVFTRRKSAKEKRLPPGPKGWPMIGSLQLLGKCPHDSFRKLANQYGPIFFMHLGSVPTVVVTTSTMAKEILKTYDTVFCSRPYQIIPSYMCYQQDIAFSPYGPHWRHVRKLATLEFFTASRLAQFQSTRQSEILAMMQSLFKEYEQGNTLKMYETLTNLTMNVSTRMLWKKSYFNAKGPKKDTDSWNFDVMGREMIALLGAINIADYIPILKPVSMTLQGLDKRMKSSRHAFDTFVGDVINVHLKANPPGTVVGKENEDFVDMLLKQTHPQTAESDPISMDCVKAIIADLLLGGTESTATSLEWAIVELMRHPNMMRKVQDELNAVAGPNRLPTEADGPSLKYLNAAIKETFRLHPPLPLGVPHESREDCEVAGYYIPKGSQVFISLHAVHRDPEVWERPLEFDPERFLKPSTIDIDVKGQHYELIPFASGRRMCPAANMATNLVQTSLAQLLHAFDWILPGDAKVEEIDMTESFGVTCPRAVSLNVFTKPRLATHVLFPASA